MSGKAVVHEFENCPEQYTWEICLPKPCYVRKHYSLLTTIYMSFLASFTFAIISYAAFAFVAGSGLAALSGSTWVAGVTIALIQGIAAMAVVARFGMLGGHFNPAAMVAEYFFGDDFANFMHLVWVFLASTAGYVVADLVLQGFLPQADLETGRVTFAAGTILAVGFFAEFVASLVLFLFAQAPARIQDASLSSWGFVTGAILIAFSITGGAVNPHIYLGKLVSREIVSGFSGDFFELSEFVTYTGAPTLAAMVAGFSHQFFVRERGVTYTKSAEEGMVQFHYGQE